jgi:hypothetical protein
MVGSVLDDARPTIQRAVSTLLREACIAVPDAVLAFVEEHADDLPALVRLEVWNTLKFGRKDGAAHQRRAERAAARESRRSGEARRPSRRTRRRSGE